MNQLYLVQRNFFHRKTCLFLLDLKLFLFFCTYFPFGSFYASKNSKQYEKVYFFKVIISFQLRRTGVQVPVVVNLMY